MLRFYSAWEIVGARKVYVRFNSFSEFIEHISHMPALRCVVKAINYRYCVVLRLRGNVHLMIIVLFVVGVEDENRHLIWRVWLPIFRKVTSWKFCTLTGI